MILTASPLSIFLLQGNRYFGMGSMNSLIYGNSAQNTIIVQKSLFQYNDMIFNNTRVRIQTNMGFEWKFEFGISSLSRISSPFVLVFPQPDTHSFIIESLGPTVVENTCFQDNLVGASDIVVFGSSFESTMNYASNTSGSLCGFSSVFQNIQQFDAFTPDCVAAESDACARYITAAPSIAPSDSPTAIASDSPSGFPTTGPTITPYPTDAPSVGPSLSPSEVGDTVPPTIPPVDFVFPETSAPAGSGNTQSVRQATAVLCMSAFLCYLFM